MTYLQMLALLEQAKYSPEQFGDLIGISGMTLRRWFKNPNTGEVPKLYLPAIKEACYQLIAQGRLQAHQPEVQAALANEKSQHYNAVLFHLGLPKDFCTQGTVSEDQILVALTQIGSQNQKQAEVVENKKKVFSFKALGAEWSKIIAYLWEVIQSKQIRSLDKLVAYGALFYLLTPFDLIPDDIPILGLVDDFGVLSIAGTYYLNSKKALRI